MCYLVSWFKNPDNLKEVELNLPLSQTFDSREGAKSRIAELFEEGAVNIELWHRVAVPKVVKTIDWGDAA